MRTTLHNPGSRNLNGWCNHAGKHHRKLGFDPLDDDDDAEDGEDLAEWLAGKPMSKAGGSIGTST